jgi:hypothetical protein
MVVRMDGWKDVWLVVWMGVSIEVVMHKGNLKSKVPNFLFQ